jgi:flagellar motor switch protein FliN
MATKVPATPQDDFNLDDIKLDDFPMEDKELFADLDAEMRTDGGTGKSAGEGLDLNLDLDGGSGDAVPALEEPGELKIEDTLDLDLNLDSELKAERGGGSDLDLNLEAPAEPSAGDLDLNLDLDTGSKGGDEELKLDSDLDLKLDEAEPAARETTETPGVDLDLDVGALDLNLEEPAQPEGERLSIVEPALSLEEPAEPAFTIEVPEEPSLSLEAETQTPEAPEDISLSLQEPEAPTAPAPEPPQPAMAAAPSAEPEAGLGEGFSLDAIPEAPGGVEEPESPQEFQAAPDVNLDDIDLSLETGGAEATDLEPKGAQVDLEAPDLAAPTMEEGFDLPPLSETKGDEDTGSAEPFVAVPDVKLTEDEVLELNLPQPEAQEPQPDFTMAPEPMGVPAMGMAGNEFRLDEPLGRAPGPAPAHTMAAQGVGGAAMPPRQAAVSQDILLSIPHKISVQMGSVNLMGKDIRNLAYGSVVQLNRTVGEPVDLLIDGRSIAQGEIVLINGKNLGVRILALHK